MYKTYIKVEDFLESLKNSVGDSSQNHLMEHNGQDYFSSPIYKILLKLYRISPVNYFNCCSFHKGISQNEWTSLSIQAFGLTTIKRNLRPVLMESQVFCLEFLSVKLTVKNHW